MDTFASTRPRFVSKRVWARTTALALGVALSASACSGAATAGSNASTGSGDAPAASIVKKLAYDATAQPDPVKHVVYLSGTWKEMGRQFADQATEELTRYVSDGISSTVSTYGWDQARKLERDYLDYYEKNAPELVDLYKGMAEGLGLSYEDFMLGIISFYEEPEQNEAEGSERAADNCSTVAAWGSQTADGKLLVGADWDSNGATAYFMPTVVAHPKDGNAFISESGFQGNLVMNDKGLVAAGSSGQSADEGDTGMGIPVMTSQWLVAANYESAEEGAKAYLEHYRTTYGDNANYNDANGGHVVIEATQSHNATRKPGDFNEKDYLITTNDFMTDEMQSSVLPAGSGYDDCRPRYYTEEKILSDAGGKATVRTLADALGSTAYYDGATWVEDNWNLETGLNSPEAVSPLYQNIMKAIASPQDGTYFVMNGCSNQEVSLLPNATGTYVRITLAGSAQDSNADARDTANTLIYNAGSAVAHATATGENPEAALNKAKEALVEGDAYTSQAGLESGTDAQALLGKATSAYLRAQSYAQAAIGDNQAVLDL